MEFAGEADEMNVAHAAGNMTTIYCTKCGQAMSVAPEHVRTTVACPHCRHRIDPWRVLGVARAAGGPAQPRQPGGYDEMVSHRSRLVAGLLGIFLGYLGIHRFYLGYTGVGVAQLLLTVFTAGIAGIWGFIEGILCLCGQMTDVDGLPLSD